MVPKHSSYNYNRKLLNLDYLKLKFIKYYNGFSSKFYIAYIYNIYHLIETDRTNLLLEFLKKI